MNISSPQDSLSQPSPQPPAVHLRRASNHRLVVSSFPQDSASSFPQTSQISVLPHTCLHRPAFPDLAKIFPREIHPTLSIEPSSSRQHKSSQSGATWLLEGAPPLRLPQNHRALLVSLSCQNFPSLVVHPCSLIGSPKVTIA
jgi:hypothetical protein